MKPTLYIVSTPIGNLEDITMRALRILAEVDLVLCEDTRVTRKLLEHYNIKTKTQSYHAHSKLAKLNSIIDGLRSGKNIALVSDAGTPIISDPGILLVQEVRKQLPETVIVPVPGASALLSVLVSAGIDAHEFVYLGFLPHKKGRETIFKEIAISGRTVVFYESVHRIEKTLESLVQHMGQDRKVCVGRELTKLYEEIVSGNPEKVQKYFLDNPDKLRGEFVVVVGAMKDIVV